MGSVAENLDPEESENPVDGTEDNKPHSCDYVESQVEVAGHGVIEMLSVIHSITHVIETFWVDVVWPVVELKKL